MFGESGMAMLLKQFGFDPTAIQEQVVTFQQNLGNVIRNFDARLTALEQGQHATNVVALESVKALTNLASSVESLRIAIELSSATKQDSTQPAGIGPTQLQVISGAANG